MTDEPALPRKNRRVAVAAELGAVQSLDADQPQTAFEFTPAKKSVCLSYLRKGFTHAGSCRAAVVSVGTFYRHIRNDKEFATAVEEAYREGTEYLEDGARTRGLEGRDEPVIFQGTPQYRRDPDTGEFERDADGKPIPLTVRRPSDNLLMFTLRSRDRQRYADFPGAMPADNNNLPVNSINVRDLIAERLQAIGGRMTVERITERLTIEPTEGSK